MAALRDYLMSLDLPFGLMDGVYALFILYGLIRGVFRGLALELAGLLGSVLIFFGAWRFYLPFAEWLLTNTRLESQKTGEIMAYLLAVLVCFLVWQLLFLLLGKFFAFAVPKVLQRPGGAVLGALKCAVTLCVLLLAVNLTPFETLKQWLVTDSAFGRATQQRVPETIEKWFPGLLPESLAPDGEAPHGSGNA